MALILKLIQSLTKDNFRYFTTSTLENDKFSCFFDTQQILNPLNYDFVFYENMNYNRIYNYANSKDYVKEVIKNDDTLINKLRITSVNDVFDAVTLSEDCYKDTDSLIDLINEISKNEFLTVKLENNINKNEYRMLPFWFNLKGMNTISDYIVALFEMRIQFLWVNKL